MDKGAWWTIVCRVTKSWTQLKQLGMFAFIVSRGLPSAVKNLPARRHRFDLRVRNIPWKMKWQLTPLFLPRKCHGQGCLAGYSPWGRKRVRHDLVPKTATNKSQQEKSPVWFGDLDGF